MCVYVDIHMLIPEVCSFLMEAIHIGIDSIFAVSFFFFFNDSATTEIYTLSLHDALPILCSSSAPRTASAFWSRRPKSAVRTCRDRKSTRLNSSHGYISYAVFCLKKKIIQMNAIERM